MQRNYFHTPTAVMSRALAVTATVAAIATAQQTSASADTDVPIAANCPSLYVFGVQGSEESSAAGVSTSDSGALGQVFGPLIATAGEVVQRAYVPYGRSADGQQLPYDHAVAAAAERLEQMAAEVVTRCPDTKIAAVGYAHGAPAVSQFAHRVGTGTAEVDAQQVAAVALLANPTRTAGTSVLPGLPATTPAPAPGTGGEKVSAITLTNPPLAGAGISAARHSVGYGVLTGRVADLCVPGDATCDAPVGAALTTTVANIAARSDLRDPITAISTVAEAMSTTIYSTAVDVVNEDLTGTSLDQLSYDPAKPLGQRLAEASQPNATAPAGHEALAALFKIGTIGLNAVVSVAQKVFTPATVAELAAVGLANPWAAVAALGAKLAGAVVELVPPQTAVGWVNDAFEAITSTITDPSQLYTVAASAQYSDTTGRHGSYRTVASTPDGRSVLAVTADWIAAVADDLAATTSRPAPGAPKPRPSTTTMTPPTTATVTSTAPTAATTPPGGP
ncbi:cutinase family protein [Nocardia lijiangensis]|uniref:cutinase family protein n=1 Tax=Nocardia lijiangensis TaxID=299618 RepID=UPI0009FDE9E0|nr:cutinase family protein [Nocardia lijiangensis]